MIITNSNQSKYNLNYMTCICMLPFCFISPYWPKDNKKTINIYMLVVHFYSFEIKIQDPDKQESL